MFYKTQMSIFETATAVGSLPIHGALALRAWSHPHKLIFSFLDDDGAESDSLTYLDLWQRADAVAEHLKAVGEPGDRVMLFFPPGLQFIAAFLGCLMARRVAVPINLPTRRRVDRCSKIIENSEARIALAPANMIDDLSQSLAPAIPHPLTWMAFENLNASSVRKPDSSSLQLNVPKQDIAFLQYTSGSTADPKGVMVTNANITANLRMMRDSWQLNHDTNMVFWQPHHHDMGLMLGQLLPIVLGNYCVLLAPSTFVRQPAIWLNAISKYKAKLAGGPNFAYELAADRYHPDKFPALDLSCWDIALNGAEVVRSATLDRFVAVYGKHGFKQESLLPCYGLAEATLFVSGGPVLKPYVQTIADPNVLEQHRIIRPPQSGGPSRQLIGCGEPSWEIEVAIVDPDQKVRLQPGQVGEIWLNGPAIAAGYWQNSNATESTFHAEIAGDSGTRYLRTGDLGFVGKDDRQVYICGRLKDLIVTDGRNLHPEDIEHCIVESADLLRAQSCAVFSVDDGRDAQKIIAAIEVDRNLNRQLNGDEKSLTAAIRSAVSSEHDVALDKILFVLPTSMRKTTSGKVQRGLMRQLYLSGDLEVINR